MNKTVKTILDILCCIGLALWTLGVFFGLHYASSSSYEVSITGALFTGLAMAFFIFLAKRYARPTKGATHAATAQTKKIVFISIYGVIALLSSWYVIHAVTASTSLRVTIQQQSQAQLNEIIAMAHPDGGSGSYKDYVKEEIRRYKDLNPSNRESKTLDFEAEQLEHLLVYDSGYDLIANQMRDFWQEADYAVKTWNPLNVTSYVVRLNALKPQWEKKLTESSRRGATGSYVTTHEDYEPLSSAPAANVDALLNPSFSSITILSVVAVILIQILILLSFFAVCRADSHGPQGVKTTPGVASW